MRSYSQRFGSLLWVVLFWVALSKSATKITGRSTNRDDDDSIKNVYDKYGFFGGYIIAACHRFSQRMQVWSYPEEIRPQPLSLLQMFHFGPICFASSLLQSDVQ